MEKSEETIDEFVISCYEEEIKPDLVAIEEEKSTDKGESDSDGTSTEEEQDLAPKRRKKKLLAPIRRSDRVKERKERAKLFEIEDESSDDCDTEDENDFEDQEHKKRKRSNTIERSIYELLQEADGPLHADRLLDLISQRGMKGSSSSVINRQKDVMRRAVANSDVIVQIAPATFALKTWLEKAEEDGQILRDYFAANPLPPGTEKIGKISFPMPRPRVDHGSGKGSPSLFSAPGKVESDTDGDGARAPSCVLGSKDDTLYWTDADLDEFDKQMEKLELDKNNVTLEMKE
eukprot:TRINITY_DN4399_c0_g1_i1.p1 TRINITY_DN4399_c0_g1~~TRINITY_DN4399_c0_g1_i1.p1  ORF type:complete len:290 (+),score=69.07 TRINITY_DN4399_c0_g1_i1:51-920(+)